MNKHIRDMLFRFSITPKLKGYEYLGLAVELVYEDKSLLQAITKELYPRVALHFGTTGHRVERAIRHAIERSYDLTDSQTFADVLGVPAMPLTGKLTNSMLIGVLAERLEDL